MISGITAGNAKDDGKEFRFWVVGEIEQWCKENDIPFDREGYGLRNSSDIEVKWGMYGKGSERNIWASCSDRTAMSILLRGDCIFYFREAGRNHRAREVRVQQEGDYVIWNEDLEHTWKVLDDSVFLTLRWRQKPD